MIEHVDDERESEGEIDRFEMNHQKEGFYSRGVEAHHARTQRSARANGHRIARQQMMTAVAVQVGSEGLHK
jgi:hypothetical protein